MLKHILIVLIFTALSAPLCAMKKTKYKSLQTIDQWPSTITMHDYDKHIELERKITRNKTLKKACCLTTIYCGLNVANSVLMVTQINRTASAPVIPIASNATARNRLLEGNNSTLLRLVSSYASLTINGLVAIGSLCFACCSWRQEHTAQQHLESLQFDIIP